MKPLLAYAALVGLPLAGLAAVLHAGRGLHAPPSLAGEWQIEWPGDMAAPPTPEKLAEIRFTLSQSGTHVAVDLFRRAYAGTLRGDSLVAESGGHSRVYDTCWDAPHARFHARVDAAVKPPRMEFFLTSPWRHPCDPPYTAVRIGARASTGGR